MTFNRIAIALVAGSLMVACANPERSRDLANPAISAVTIAQQVCSDCHGVTGNAVSPNFPNLAGQTAAYTASQLRGFKGHSRQDPAGFEYMWGMSRRLTEEQITGLAEYYAKQVPARQPLQGDPARLPRGKSIFEAGLAAKGVPPCSACHGSEAQGNDTIPRLAGQHMDYVVKQLAVFQRTNDRPEGAIMKTIAHELSAEDIKDIAAYLQSLPNR